jgi:signal recognition particle receptor subunit beta
MVQLDFAQRQLICNIIYVGPAGAGKRTSLRAIAKQIPANMVLQKSSAESGGAMMVVDLHDDRLHGNVLKTRVIIKSTGAPRPDQVAFDTLLNDIDGVIFVGDSQLHRLDANQSALEELANGLRCHGLSLSELPHIFQWNKSEMPDAVLDSDLNRRFNRFDAPSVTSTALLGRGIEGALETVTRAVLSRFSKRSCRCRFYLQSHDLAARSRKRLPMQE